MSKFTKQHYEFLAAFFSKQILRHQTGLGVMPVGASITRAAAVRAHSGVALVALRQIVYDLVMAFEQDNEMFSRSKFWLACGIPLSEFPVAERMSKNG